MQHNTQPPQLRVYLKMSGLGIQEGVRGRCQRLRGNDRANAKERLKLRFGGLSNAAWLGEKRNKAVPGAELRLCPVVQLRGMMRNHGSNQGCRSSWVMHPLQQITDHLLDGLVLLVALGSRQSKPC